MIYDLQNTAGKKVEVYDAMGKRLNMVTSYDTETREAILLVGTGKKNSDSLNLVIVKNEQGANIPLSVKVKLLGSKIIVDGVEY